MRQSRQVSNSEMRLSHEFVIRKSETFEDHLASNIVFLLKKYFCGRPGELFFSSPGAPETNVLFLLALHVHAFEI